ncbi:MAG: hypothetical protein AAB256_06200, partial [Deltaproteobacteria bacterium]
MKEVRSQGPAPAGGKQGSEFRSQKLVISNKKVKRFLVFFSLFTVLVGCGINKDIYQKTVEESEARKA